jgi:hypothetical protein
MKNSRKNHLSISALALFWLGPMGLAQANDIGLRVFLNEENQSFIKKNEPKDTIQLKKIQVKNLDKPAQIEPSPVVNGGEMIQVRDKLFSPLKYYNNPIHHPLISQGSVR